MTLYYDYDDSDIETSTDDDDDPDWDEPLPAAKLWVHPDIRYKPAVFTDQSVMDDRAVDDIAKRSNDEKIGWRCPNPSCDDEYAIGEAITYQHMVRVNGLIRCGTCRMAMLAHQAPPEDIKPSGPGGPQLFGGSAFP